MLQKLEMANWVLLELSHVLSARKSPKIRLTQPFRYSLFYSRCWRPPCEEGHWLQGLPLVVLFVCCNLVQLIGLWKSDDDSESDARFLECCSKPGAFLPTHQGVIACRLSAFSSLQRVAQTYCGSHCSWRWWRRETAWEQIWEASLAFSWDEVLVAD